MNISSAHVFARQIKSSGGPHPNWLYYGGEFNTNYMPSGFTNFADELVTFRGSTGTLNYQLNYANTNFLSQYMGTPHIIQLLGNDACSWELTNGELKNIQTGTIPQGADLFNNYHGAILIPVSIPATFTKAYIQFELTGEEVGYMNTAEMHTMEHLAATYLRNEPKWKDKVLYFGPMGCRTGFYLLLAGDYTSRDALPLVLDCFRFVRDFRGEVPGASAKDCGNYLDMNLPMANYWGAKYKQLLETMDESRMHYPK